MSGKKEFVIETRYYTISRYMETEIKRRLVTRNCNESEKDILSKYFQLKDLETELMTMYPEYKRVNYNIGVQAGARIQYDSAMRELDRYELNINRNKAEAEELHRINVRKMELKSHINELVKASEVLLPALEPAGRSSFTAFLKNINNLDSYSITSLETLETKLIEQLKQIQNQICQELKQRGSALSGEQLSLIEVSAYDYATELAALDKKLCKELSRFKLNWDRDVPESFKIKIEMIKKSPWLDWLDSNAIPIEIADISARRDMKQAALMLINECPIDSECPEEFIQRWGQVSSKLQALLSNLDDGAYDWNLIQHEHEQLCDDIQSSRKRTFIKSLMTERLLEQGLNVVYDDGAHDIVYSESQPERWYEVSYESDGGIVAQECIDIDTTTTSHSEHETNSLCDGFTEALLQINEQKDADVRSVQHAQKNIKKKRNMHLNSRSIAG